MSCALVTVVQTCALPISVGVAQLAAVDGQRHAAVGRGHVGRVVGTGGRVGRAVHHQRHVEDVIGGGQFGRGEVGEALDELAAAGITVGHRSEEHTSELQSLMSISYAVFCLKKNNNKNKPPTRTND